MITLTELPRVQSGLGDRPAKIKCVTRDIAAILSCHSGPHKWPQCSGQTISLRYLPTCLLSSVSKPQEMAAMSH